jgi:hypothetical protein
MNGSSAVVFDDAGRVEFFAIDEGCVEFFAIEGGEITNGVTNGVDVLVDEKMEN